MKKILLVLVLGMSLVAINAEARGGGGWGWHHGGRYFFYGALTFPLWYSAWAYSRPYPYYYYPAPVYVQSSPTYYVQSTPNYGVTSQPNYVVTGQQSTVGVPQASGVIELGPVNGGAQQSVQPSLANAPPSQPVQSGAQGDRWFVYPGRGQTQAQLDADRSQCSSWAVGASGYDPDLKVHRNPETGPIDYGRALSACLEGRGYTVR